MAYSIKELNSRIVWDDFRLKHCPGALFQGWLWGEHEKAAGIKISRYGIYDNSKLIGIFLVIKTVARRGNFLHVRHGPILAANNEKIWNEIFKFLASVARQENCWFIRISPLVVDSPEIRSIYRTFHLVPAAIHAMDAEQAWVLDINKSEEELLAGMRKTTRYEIKQAQKLGVEIVKSYDKKDLNDFLALYRETSERHGFVPHLGIREEFEVYSREKCALLLLGKYLGKVLAGAIIIFDGNQAIYHHGASVWSKVPVTYLIQWEAIKEAKKRGIKIYNFWGIAPGDMPNQPWRGITLFKTGFGGRAVSFLHAHDLPVSKKYFFTRSIESLRRIAKGY